MLAPFAYLLLPISGLFAALVAGSLFAFRQKKWFVILWLPAALWSLFGSIVFLLSLSSFISFAHQGGESAGFMALAAMFVMGRTFLFVVALVCCGIAHPKKEQIQFRFFAPPILGVIILLIGISFFTRCYRSVLVVDSENEPVANAWVSYSSSDEHDLLDQLFTTKGTVETDSNGKAMVYGYLNQDLEISAGAEGYYGSMYERSMLVKKLARAFAAPFVFHLKKKGEHYANSLITSQYGMRDGLWVNVPRDGTPVSVDLLNRKIGNGSLEISQKKPDYPAHGGAFEYLNPSDQAKWIAATNWSFAMKLNDGGFLEEDEEFAFNPPESGYQPVVAFNFQKGQTNWTTELQKDFYIKVGNPPLYGHLHIETSSFQNTIILTYSINPDGSRNLEPNPN